MLRACVRGGVSGFLRSYGLHLGVVLTMVTVFAVAAESIVHRVVDAALKEDAERKAVVWAAEFVEQVPGLPEIIRTGRATRAQATRIRSTLAAGDIFRFELFSPNGWQAYVADRSRVIEDRDAATNAQARTVFQTGEHAIFTGSGVGRADRPDYYVEAYVPARARDGTPFGVIEVYVDAAALSSALHASIRWLGTLLLAGSAIICTIPSLVAIHKHNRIRQRDRELIRLSRFDALTGTLNRSALTEAMSSLFTPDRTVPVGLFFVDVDKFKDTNDTYGHDFGDQLLCHIAQVIQSKIRDCDILARNGGDEFVVLLPDIEKPELLQLAESLLERVVEPFQVDGATMLPSLSIGAHLSEPGESEHRALHAADLAVYQAKSEGRGRVCGYSARLDQDMQRRRYVEKALGQDLDAGAFSVVYQPIYAVDTMQIVGFEALLRMTSPEGAPIAPDEFIPIAEGAGMIEGIGQWVLRTALIEASVWPSDIYVSVNVSSRQFRSGRLVGEVTATLAETGVAPDRLVLEVTESLLIENEDNVGDQIVTLKNMGISIALDDFGTGYSSLGHLWKFPFDKIKIDRVFLEGFNFFSDKYGEVIATLVMLGRKLGMAVTVEGVERGAQLTLLQDLGCDEVQGFLLDRPMAAQDVHGRLADQAHRRHA